jgi:hypothetical protein
VTLFILSVTRSGAANSSHIYFGSDTHSIGLFLGAALAVSWVPENFTHEISTRAKKTIDIVTTIGILGILGCFFFIHESSSLIYTLAFPLASLAGTVAIAGLIHPACQVSRQITFRPLLWLGERSYGIYLWHWIIFNVTRPNIDITGPQFSLNIVRILIVLAIADLSYRMIELPVRNRHLSQWFLGLRYRLPKERKKGYLTFYGSITVATTIALLSLVGANATAHPMILGADKNGGFTSFPSPGNSLGNMKPGDPLSNGVWLTGDSIILGIRQEMSQRYHLSVINARVGRQIDELISVAQQDKPLAKNAPVVVDVGNNNIITQADLITLLNIFAHQPWVVLVNTAVPRTYRDSNNTLISSVASQYKNVRVVDWNAISNGHPEYFAPDGVHLVSQGVYAYMGIINETISQLEKPFH